MRKYGKWIAGVIASGVIWEYIAKPLFHIFSNMSSGLLNSIVNYYFSCCRSARIESLIIHIALLGLSVYYFTVIKDSIGVIKDINVEKKKCEEIENKIDGIGMPKVEKKIEKSLEEKSIIDTKKELLKEVRHIRASGKRVGIILRICILMLILSFVNIIAFTVAPCLTRIAFEESIIKITPYTQQDEIDKLKSDWTRMETKEDYQNIKFFVDDVIEENELK